MTHKITIILCCFFISINQNIAQKKLFRYRNLNEIFVNAQANKVDLHYLILGIGYERSLSKSKRYLSVATEYLTPVSDNNGGDAILSTLKINFQREQITSFGVGMKYNFRFKEVNFIASGGYKYDFVKFKLTLSANFLFEVQKIAYNKINPNPLGSICYGNCREYDTVWRFGLSVGKYF